MPEPVFVKPTDPPTYAEIVAVVVPTLTMPELVRVSVPVPPSVMEPSSNVMPATPVTVPLIVTVDVPVPLVPAEKSRCPIRCH